MSETTADGGRRATTAALRCHKFNRAGMCVGPEVIVVDPMPEHFHAEVRLALAVDGWRMGWAYDGPPIGVSSRGVLPCRRDAAFSDRRAALAVGLRQLLVALAAKERARKAARAVEAWAAAHGIALHDGDDEPAALAAA